MAKWRTLKRRKQRQRKRQRAEAFASGLVKADYINITVVDETLKRNYLIGLSELYRDGCPIMGKSFEIPLRTGRK